MIKITMQKIIDASPCKDGLERILSTHGHLPKDQEWPLVDAFQACNMDDVLWSLRCLPEHNNLWRKHAVWCASQVKHLMTDKRSINALRIAWMHSNGEAADVDLSAARAAARAAAGAAARDGAWAAQKRKLIEILTAGEWVGGCPLDEVE